MIIIETIFVLNVIVLVIIEILIDLVIIEILIVLVNIEILNVFYIEILNVFYIEILNVFNIEILIDLVIIENLHIFLILGSSTLRTCIVSLKPTINTNVTITMITIEFSTVSCISKTNGTKFFFFKKFN